MPRVQTAEIDPMNNLGELLIEFLDYYGNRLAYDKVALRMDPPGFEKKADLKRKEEASNADPKSEAANVIASELFLTEYCSAYTATTGEPRWYVDNSASKHMSNTK